MAQQFDVIGIERILRFAREDLLAQAGNVESGEQGWLDEQTLCDIATALREVARDLDRVVDATNRKRLSK